MDAVLQSEYTRRVITPGVELIIGDSLQVMPQLTHPFDVCILDPPYNAGKGYGDHCPDYMPNWQYRLFIAAILYQAVHLARVIVVLPGYRHLPNWIDVWEPLVMSIWYKGRVAIHDLSPLGRYGCYWEPILLYSSEKKAPWRCDIPGWFTGQTASPEPEHPNCKPVWLLSQILKVLNSASVLDPFVGTGTTLYAAKSVGYSYALGIEIHEKYVPVIERRFKQGFLPLQAETQQEDLPFAISDESSRE